MEKQKTGLHGNNRPIFHHNDFNKERVQNEEMRAITDRRLHNTGKEVKGQQTGLDERNARDKDPERKNQQTADTSRLIITQK